jgi:hypothetical protein
MRSEVKLCDGSMLLPLLLQGLVELKGVLLILSFGFLMVLARSDVVQNGGWVKLICLFFCLVELRGEVAPARVVPAAGRQLGFSKLVRV